MEQRAEIDKLYEENKELQKKFATKAMDEKNHMLDAMGQRQEAEQMKVIAEKTFAENAKHLEELEAKAARVDDLENKLALLEQDKEILKREA